MTNRSATPAPNPNTLDDEPRLNVPAFVTTPASATDNDPVNDTDPALTNPEPDTVTVLIGSTP